MSGDRAPRTKLTLKRRRLARVIEISTRRASYDVRESDFRGSGFTNFTRAIPRDPAAIIAGPWPSLARQRRYGCNPRRHDHKGRLSYRAYTGRAASTLGKAAP